MSKELECKMKVKPLRVAKGVKLDWAKIPSDMSFAIVSANHVYLTNYDPAYWCDDAQDYLPKEPDQDGCIDGKEPKVVLLTMSSFGVDVMVMQRKLGLDENIALEMITPFYIEQRPDGVKGSVIDFETEPLVGQYIKAKDIVYS